MYVCIYIYMLMYRTPHTTSHVPVMKGDCLIPYGYILYGIDSNQLCFLNLYRCSLYHPVWNSAYNKTCCGGGGGGGGGGWEDLEEDLYIFSELHF